MRNKLLILLGSVCLIAILAALPFMAACPAPAEEEEEAPEAIEWQCSFWGPLGSRVWPVWPWYIEEISERTDGQFKITVQPGAALGPPKEQLDGIKAGLFDMAHYVAGYTPDKDPLGMFFETPGLLPEDISETCALFYYFQRECEPWREWMLEQWNAVPMGLTHPWFLYKFLSTKPVRTLDDWAGLRARVTSPVAKLMGRWGIAATMVPAPEVYDMIQKGTLDCVYFHETSHYSYKIHEVTDYLLCNTGLTSGMSPFVVANADSWNALPDEIKEAHWELTEELMLRRFPAELEKKVEEIHREWQEDYGIEFIELDPDARAEIMKAGEGMLREYAQELDAKGLPGSETLDWLLAKRQEISGY